MMDKDLHISRTVSLLRFPLAVMVVWIHTNAYGLCSLSEMQAHPFALESLYRMVCIALTKVASHIAVPTFFLFSGYYFFYKMKVWDWKQYGAKLKKRVYTLLVPFLLWNLLPFFIKIVLGVVQGESLQQTLAPTVAEGWYRIFWGASSGLSMPMNAPMWFIRNLIFLCLLSPVIYYGLKKLHWGLLLLLGALCLSGESTSLTCCSFSDLFYFSLGAYFSLYNISFVETFKKVRIPVFLLAVIALVVVVWFDGRETSVGKALFPAYVMLGCITAINASAYVVERFKVIPNKFLSDSSFFIYASHMVYILYSWDMILCRFFPPITLGNSSLVFFGMPIACVITCLLLYALMRRFTPRTLSVLMGNR